jgi:hypothetical protein
MGWGCFIDNGESNERAREAEGNEGDTRKRGHKTKQRGMQPCVADSAFMRSVVFRIAASITVTLSVTFPDALIE